MRMLFFTTKYKERLLLPLKSKQEEIRPVVVVVAVVVSFLDKHILPTVVVQTFLNKHILPNYIFIPFSSLSLESPRQNLLT